MSKFNKRAEDRELTANLNGHAAYKMTDKEKLMTQVLTSFINEKKFYGDNTDELVKTLLNVIDDDAAFVSKLAVFARREFGMRSVSHILTAYLAHEPKGKPFVRGTVKGITLRGDDVTELMAFYLSTFGKPVPNSLKKGINDVLAGFDEYTLAKYKGNKKGVKMRDVICICRPTPQNDDQSRMWKRCIEDKLAVPQTWETVLSAQGNNKQTWERLIDSGKVGYMALLRNLSNITDAGPENIEKVFSKIEDPEGVRHSKQLPFRFVSAYRAVADKAGSRLLEALESAAAVSVENCPKLSGTTVIAVDTSGSMCCTLSYKSAVTSYDIAYTLGLIANRICENSYFYTFDIKLEKMSYPRNAPILSTVMQSRGAGGGTDMRLPFDELIKKKIRADRIIVISDNECNRGFEPVQKLLDKYRQSINPNVWLHAIDIMGYGTQQFRGEKFNLITGWSDKVLEFIELAENGTQSLIGRIESYSIT